MLVTGGRAPGDNGKVNSEIYSPATNTFAVVGKMSRGRHSHTATLFSDGSAVLITEGFSSWPATNESAELFVRQKEPDVSVTVTSNPSGLTVVDSLPVETPHTFSWIVRSCNTGHASYPPAIAELKKSGGLGRCCRPLHAGFCKLLIRKWRREWDSNPR